MVHTRCVGCLIINIAPRLAQVQAGADGGVIARYFSSSSPMLSANRFEARMLDAFDENAAGRYSEVRSARLLEGVTIAQQAEGQWSAEIVKVRPSEAIICVRAHASVRRPDRHVVERQAPQSPSGNTLNVMNRL